ncbi:MAG: HAMP domain-containing sensor histidine kinase [Leeuwenhoekiella sp.]
MNKKLFVLLVVLMSLSLIGIIFVQGYWITNSIETKRGQFAFNAKQVLGAVADQMRDLEIDNLSANILSLRDKNGDFENEKHYDLLYSKNDTITDDIYLLQNGILEQDHKLSIPVLDFEIDSIKFKRYLERQAAKIVDYDGKSSINRQARLSRIVNMNDLERYTLEQIVSEVSHKVPIHKRVKEDELSRLLTIELAERELKTSFEFAVYNNDLMTAVHSDGFDNGTKETTFSEPLFTDMEGDNDYQLLANFPGEKRFVISSVMGMAALSILFTLIIVIAYASALQQLVKQRQISEIKTDFINNMTHEFKTPIATINLALDAIRNPKIADNPDSLKRYMGMIREENKRMHAQVENVLRISKLEKNQLDITKERLKLHDLIEDAITHIELIVEDRGGYVKTHLGALKSSILANESHFTNVIVNILENAVKYTTGKPEIDVYTENVKNFIVMKIKDNGDGMSKNSQKRIFDKFYREHTGDIHNVKGHGLGLAYAKRIVQDHTGEIYVQSEKGKGSTFIIKLPLIS